MDDDTVSSDESYEVNAQVGLVFRVLVVVVVQVSRVFGRPFSDEKGMQ